jgi:hypothetical protein
MFLSMMQEYLNRNLKFHEYSKENFDLSAKDNAHKFLSSRFPHNKRVSMPAENLNVVNEAVNDEFTVESNYNEGESGLQLAVIEEATATPVNKNTMIIDIPDGCNNPSHRDGSASVIRKLQITRTELKVTRTSPEIDISSGILDLDIPQTAQRMADHFIDDLLNNSAFDTESTVLTSLPLRMPSMITGLKKTHAFLVPVDNPGNQCYAIAVLQLLQLLPEFWSDLVTSLAVEGVMFEDFCE